MADWMDEFVNEIYLIQIRYSILFYIKTHHITYYIKAEIQNKRLLKQDKKNLTQVWSHPWQLNEQLKSLMKDKGIVNIEVKPFQFPADIKLQPHLFIYNQIFNTMSLRSKKLVQAAMLLRPQYKKFQGRLHPRYAQKLVQTTQQPLPLKYKIHPLIKDLSMNYPHPEPLKPIETLPFSIERTATGNLPVYIQYNTNHHIKRTVIRKISGDVDKFCEELKKVVSNHEVRKKVGYVEIPGVHKESVFHWLIRLGF